MTAVTIVDYGLANIRSVVNAVEYLGVEVALAATPQAIDAATRIVLPGVGSFDAGMRGLRERGLIEPLARRVLGERVPFLGVCLGMQFLMESSEEGVEPGLGWIKGHVRRFPSGKNFPKVPHIGWNDVKLPRPSRMFAGMEGGDFYFVHSFYVAMEDEAASCASALCDYGGTFVAALERDNIMACQFHPEKSQMAGAKLVQNFVTGAGA
jgi:imidazole glycerol phosphate synthase glutamine amidotransferase subunit